MKGQVTKFFMSARATTTFWAFVELKSDVLTTLYDGYEATHKYDYIEV